jgi:hypothetical protein
MQSVRANEHASFLEMISDRKLFTNRGLHLNGVGKETNSLPHICNTRPEKVSPIILSWNSAISYTDTLHQGRIINRTSTRTKKAPTMKSGDILW